MRGRVVIVGLLLVVVAATIAFYRAAGGNAIDDRPLPAIIVEALSVASTACELVAAVAEPIENESRPAVAAFAHNGARPLGRPRRDRTPCGGRRLCIEAAAAEHRTEPRRR